MSEYGKMTEQHEKENKENERDAYSKSQEGVHFQERRYARKKGGDWLEGKNPPYINIDYNKKFSSSTTYSEYREKTYTYSQGTGSYSGSINSDGSVSISENTTEGTGTKVVKGTNSTSAHSCGKVIRRGTWLEVSKKENELWKRDLKLFLEIRKGKPTKILPSAVLRLFYLFQCILGLATIATVFLLPTVQPGVYAWENWIVSYSSIFNNVYFIIAFVTAIVFAVLTIFFAAKINRYIGCYSFLRKIKKQFNYYPSYLLNTGSIIQRYMEEFAKIDGISSGEPHDYVPDYDTLKKYEEKYCSRSKAPKAELSSVIASLVLAVIIFINSCIDIDSLSNVLAYAFIIILLIYSLGLLYAGIYAVVKCPLAKIIERDVRLRSAYAASGDYQETLKLIDEIRSYTVR